MASAIDRNSSFPNSHFDRENKSWYHTTYLLLYNRHYTVDTLSQSRWAVIDTRSRTIRYAHFRVTSAWQKGRELWRHTGAYFTVPYLHSRFDREKNDAYIRGTCTPPLHPRDEHRTIDRAIDAKRTNTQPWCPGATGVFSPPPLRALLTEITTRAIRSAHEGIALMYSRCQKFEFREGIDFLGPKFSRKWRNRK